MNVKLADTLDRLSLYLPAILMGVMALATYWLVHSTPGKSIATTVSVPPHEPDYFMRNFSVKTFHPSGALKSEVKGALARHYPDTDTLEIEQVQIRSYDAQGQLTTASANRALTNAQASEVQLMGQAEVVRAATVGPNANAPLRYSGAYLHAFLEAKRITSDQPVLLERGLDRFTAQSLDYDDNARQLMLQGRVKGVLMPQASVKNLGK